MPLEDCVAEGGCLCGELRYQVTRDPIDTGYCHCEICRRSTGAPVLVWASFPIDSFSYTKGQPKIFHSSSNGQRQFCAECGTQICYRDTLNAETVDVNVGSLDSPQAYPPGCHIYTKDQISWFETTDHLPRYEHSEPSAK